MSVTKNTPIQELKFFGSWRVHRSLDRYNESVDLSSRILTVKDILSKGKDIIDLYGIGPRTYDHLFYFLKENGL